MNEETSESVEDEKVSLKQIIAFVLGFTSAVLLVRLLIELPRTKKDLDPEVSDAPGGHYFPAEGINIPASTDSHPADTQSAD